MLKLNIVSLTPSNPPFVLSQKWLWFENTPITDTQPIVSIHYSCQFIIVWQVNLMKTYKNPHCAH